MKPEAANGQADSARGAEDDPAKVGFGGGGGGGAGSVPTGAHGEPSAEPTEQAAIATGEDTKQRRREARKAKGPTAKNLRRTEKKAVSRNALVDLRENPKVVVRGADADAGASAGTSTTAREGSVSTAVKGTIGEDKESAAAVANDPSPVGYAESTGVGFTAGEDGRPDEEQGGGKAPAVIGDSKVAPKVSRAQHVRWYWGLAFENCGSTGSPVLFTEM